MKHFISFFTFFVFLTGLSLQAQESSTDYEQLYKSLNRRFESVGHRLDVVEKAIDDIYWHNKVGDIAETEGHHPDIARRPGQVRAHSGAHPERRGRVPER